MGLWLKGYEYREINKKINDYLKLEKEIHLDFFPKGKDENYAFNKDLVIFIINGKEIIEKKYINPRKKINKNFNSLSEENNERLRLFLNTCGKDLLEYQHKNINFEEITKRLDSVINNEKN